MGGGGAGSSEAGAKFRHAEGREPLPQLCWPVRLLSDSAAWTRGWGRGPRCSRAPKLRLEREGTPHSHHALPRYPHSPSAPACISGESGTKRKHSPRVEGDKSNLGPFPRSPSPRVPAPQPAPKAHLYSPSRLLRVRGYRHRCFSGILPTSVEPGGRE